MTTANFETYRHSGKFGFHGPVLVLLITTIAAFPLGLLYAYVIKWIPIIYVNVFATAGYGLVFGWLTTRLLKFGKVRNTAIAAMSGLVAGAIALYFNWNGHVHALFEDAPYLIHPAGILEAVKYLYENGSWGLGRRSSENMTGIMLGIVWAVEAGIILVMSVIFPFATISDTPFCEENKCWLDEEKKIDTLDVFHDPAQIASLQSGDLGPLAQARPRFIGADAFTRLTIKHSAKCNSFCTVKLEHVVLTTDKNGNVSEKTHEITHNLILPHSMFDLIAKFEKFQPQSPSAQGAALG